MTAPVYRSPGSATDFGPAHIVDGDVRRSLCGLKNPMPIVAVQWVDAHVDGWGMVVCPECLDRTELVEA